MNKLIGAVATVALLAVADQAHAARDQIWAVGSSTVFPFSTRVAENLTLIHKCGPNPECKK